MNKGKNLKYLAALLTVLLISFAALAAVPGAKKDGLVEYIGSQKEIFKTGTAISVLSLEQLSGTKGLFAVGPVDGLDGEITIFDSKPYITKVRGADYVLDATYNHGAFFLVWTNRTTWRDVPIPASVRGYADLQRFVKDQALTAGIDATKPFPFLLSGVPAEIKWHINVDRTGGQRITKELFAKSKERYVLTNEPVDIVGFYAENHPGEFISQFAPAFNEGSGTTNAIHIHVVSRNGKAAGHIDDILLGTGMVLRLPAP